MRRARAVAWAAALAAGMIGVAGAIALADPTPATPLRHLYVLPVGLAAVRLGGAGGLAAAVGAVVLHAPFVLPHVEREGLTAAGGEGLVTFAILLGLGALGGALAGEAARQRARYETLVAVQRILADDVPLPLAARRLHACLAGRLRADALAVVLRHGDDVHVAGAERVAPASAAARVLATGEPLFVPAAAPGPRPRRALVTPLLARGATVGALALERQGEIDGAERAALAALGAHLGLALENARLASRQRRFAAELAQRVTEATARLEEINRLKSDFVAVASHELRTPLTAIEGFAELLATRRYPPAEVQRLAGVVREAAARLTRIVADLLDLARLERGLAPALHRRPLAVAPVLGAVTEVMARASRRHRFVVDCAQPLPPVDADPDALERILTNLLANAAKYSPAGTAVRVQARAAAAGGVEFVVEDEGPGIAAEALPHVFEPYYRAPGAAAAARGAGIGLAVVKSLVEAHGGAIRAERAPARGTRMTFHLPAVP